MRSYNGRFISAFSANLGGGSITHAELAAIVWGLRMAWEKGARKVELQTDSLTAVQLLRTEVKHHQHRTMITAARRLLELNWEVRIKHVFRESNFVADYMASIGHSMPVGVHMFDVPSPMMNYWLYYDLVGVQTPRLINN
ncbi:unnamed protein product [Linum tenue]|uniref:RNase H type-1 domain-containing protein n=1 Tax=Linum tenue TaxID=586396 RepID=A0AAV0NL10_9ROSI|nr:unnamed protein product [Linum tenue]